MSHREPNGPPSSARPVRAAGRLLACVLALAGAGTLASADGPDGIVGESSGAVLAADLGQVYSMLDYYAGQPAYAFRVAPLRSIRRLLDELSYRR